MRLTYTLGAAVAAPFLILLAGCGADDAAASGGGPGGGPGRGEMTPQAVEIATVERARMARTSLVTGQLTPLRVVGVNAQSNGALVNVLVEEGSRVRRGQLLAEVDRRELDAQLEAAEANLTVARSVAERSAALRQSQVITDVEFERDQAALVAAEASVSQLRTRIAFTRAVSPIDGVVTQRFAQTGDVVGNNARLFTVADVSTLVAQLPVSELEVPLLREGAPVDVQVDALGRAVPGRIRRIFPAADSVTRLVPVEVAINNAQGLGLKPGFSVRVSLQLDERDNALVIPTRAVMGAVGARSVFVIRDGRAERRPVRVGTDLDGRMEVFEGLQEGDSVITTGNALLRDGAPVRIAEPLAEPARSGVSLPATDSTALPPADSAARGTR